MYTHINKKERGIMKLIGNIIWVVFGGLIIAIEYVLASIPFFVSIIGIPSEFRV